MCMLSTLLLLSALFSLLLLPRTRPSALSSLPCSPHPSFLSAPPHSSFALPSPPYPCSLPLFLPLPSACTSSLSPPQLVPPFPSLFPPACSAPHPRPLRPPATGRRRLLPPAGRRRLLPPAAPPAKHIGQPAAAPTLPTRQPTGGRTHAPHPTTHPHPRSPPKFWPCGQRVTSHPIHSRLWHNRM